MSQTYRYYRQINYRNHDEWEQPEMSDVEEIWCDDNTQVHHLTHEEVSTILQNLNSSFYLLQDRLTESNIFDSDLSSGGRETDYFFDRIRHLNPNEVMVSDLNYSHQTQANWKNELAKIGRFAKHKVNKLTQMIQCFPDALKAAWTTLNS